MDWYRDERQNTAIRAEACMTEIQGMSYVRGGALLRQVYVQQPVG